MDAITADRAVARVTRISENIELAEQVAASVADELIDKLVADGVLRVHRSWSKAVELQAIRETAAKALVGAVLASGWVDLPAEVQWLHVDRHADAVAAQ